MKGSLRKIDKEKERGLTVRQIKFKGEDLLIVSERGDDVSLIVSAQGLLDFDAPRYYVQDGVVKQFAGNKEVGLGKEIEVGKDITDNFFGDPTELVELPATEATK